MLLFKLTLLVLLYQETIADISIFPNPANNACPSWNIYDTRSVQTECTVNQDGDRNLVEISIDQNYPAEPHTVSTKDNYELIQFRIPNDKGTSTLVIHGLGQNAIGFTLDGPGSLAFVLAKAGKDVWLGNMRGTSYSSNTVYGEDSQEYWDFTPYEMGTIDIPAILEYIYSVNGNNRIEIIAYSLGTTCMLIYTSMMPQHANKYILRQVLMAPIATLNNLDSPLKFTPMVWNTLGTGLEASNQYYIMKPTPASRQAAVLAFTPFLVPNVKAFWGITGTIFGYSCQFNPETYYVFIKHGGDAICVQVLDFYTNIIEKGVFVAYDYGSDAENYQHYGTSTPPTFPVNEIQTPTGIVYGLNDQLATEENVLALAAQMPSTTCVARVPFDKFEHIDFVHAKDAEDLLYQPVLEMLQGSCYNEDIIKCTQNFP